MIKATTNVVKEYYKKSLLIAGAMLIIGTMLTGCTSTKVEGTTDTTEAIEEVNKELPTVSDNAHVEPNRVLGDFTTNDKGIADITPAIYEEKDGIYTLTYTIQGDIEGIAIDGANTGKITPVYNGDKLVDAIISYAGGFIVIASKEPLNTAIITYTFPAIDDTLFIRYK